MLETWNQQSIKGLLAKQYRGRETCPVRKGLAIRFGARGAVFEWQRRVNGTPRTIKLGTFGPDFGLADARAKAAEINEDLAAGVDVYVKHGAGIAPEETGRRKRGQMTCQEAWDAYIAEISNGTGTTKANADSTKDDKEGYWRRYWKDEIADMMVADLTFEDVYEVTDNLSDRPSARRNAIAYLSKFLKWCRTNRLKTGMGQTLPTDGIDRGSVTKRDRYFSHEEIRWFWTALDDLTPVWRDYYICVLLTGMRRTEISELRRAEVMRADTCFDIAAERMKGKTRFLAPVGHKTWKIVSERLRRHNSEFVFRSAHRLKDAPISGYSYVVKKLRETMAALAAKQGKTIEPWSTHSLRHTFSTLANGLRDEDERALLDPGTVEQCMAHKIPGIAGVYNHNQYFADKRRAWRIWEDEVRRIVGDEMFERY
ncbi:integrase [Novosphingobium indicum]|uniref:Integrase n=1 Tax=Novosphingobium indicum TaxID=462949 RepID=A0ABQ2JZ06_9SPHN|nr:integrase family protein [Novosphingobium indicum]GGN58956.1 integrase [Novosphingobium indicum]